MAEPLFIKHADVLHVNGDIALTLCREADGVVPGSAICAQKIRGLWYLYINCDESRILLLQCKFVINGKLVPVLGTNPFETNTNDHRPPLEKITFKDIPLGDPNGTTLINNYLREHPHITVTSNVGYSKLQSKSKKDDMLYMSGERFVYAEADFTPALPGNTQIGNYNVRIFHRSQEVFCKRCKTKNMHKTSDVHECAAYRDDQDSVIAFRGDCNIFSNFFICKVNVFGMDFRSAEHAYQWRKCLDCLRPDLAAKITKAATPKRAKMIANEVHPRQLDLWHRAKGHIIVMSEVLYAKSQSNIDFRAMILNSGDKLLAESTRDLKWGTGLAPHLTKSSLRFPGENLLGVLLMELREKLRLGTVPTSPPIPHSLLTFHIDLTKPPPTPSDASTPNAHSPELAKVVILDEDDFTTKLIIETDNMPTTSSVDMQPTVDTTVDAADDVPLVSSPRPLPSPTPPSVCASQATPPTTDCVPTPTVLNPQWRLSNMNTNSKRPARTPLVGKLLTGRRRLATPIRRIKSHRQTLFIPSDTEYDSEDDESLYWDRDSIASEIMTCSDFDGVFANNSDI